MIVTCAQCQARFKLADEKLKAGGTKVRCSKCQTIFTVFPPEQEADAAPAFIAPAVAAPEAPPAAPPAPEPAGQEADSEPSSPETPPGDMAFDFGTEPAGVAAGSEENSFSFAEPSTAESVATPSADLGFATTAGRPEDAGDFDFETTFAADSTGTPEPAGQDAGMVEFDFGTGEEPGSEPAAEPAGEFDFSEPPAGAVAPNEFSFDEATSAEGPTEFDFPAETESFAATETDAGEEDSAGFGEVSFAAGGDEGFAFDEQSSEETSPFGTEDDRWGEPESPELGSFDFEEPSFESQASVEAKPKESSLGFGEIDFSDDDTRGESLPSFDSVPDFAPAPAPSEAVAPVLPPPPPAATPAPPVQRQTTSRPRSEEHPPPLAPRRSPVSKMVVGLIVLLVVLCGAGGYLYVSGDGQRLLGQLTMKLKGESPSVPGEQLIGLKDITSSYVNNREAGQLLVINGSAVNNFTSTRSAIAVKGVLLDGTGKVLQQQQAFCGNPLSEEKLRTLRFTEIEEAMHNQFGDSLSNMNVKAGTALKFTIVFRNVPKEMANINVEVVDSKPGSL